MTEQRQRRAQLLLVKRKPESMAAALRTVKTAHFSRRSSWTMASPAARAPARQASWMPKKRERPSHSGQRCSLISQLPYRYFRPRSHPDIRSYPSANPVQKLTMTAEARNKAKLISEGLWPRPHWAMARAQQSSQVGVSLSMAVWARRQARKQRACRRSMYFFQPSLGALLNSSRNSPIWSSSPQRQQSVTIAIPSATPSTTWFRLCAPRYMRERATSRITQAMVGRAMDLRVAGKQLKKRRKMETVANQLCPEGLPNSLGQQAASERAAGSVQKGRGS